MKRCFWGLAFVFTLLHACLAPADEIPGSLASDASQPSSIRGNNPAPWRGRFILNISIPLQADFSAEDYYTQFKQKVFADSQFRQISEPRFRFAGAVQLKIVDLPEEMATALIEKILTKPVTSSDGRMVDFRSTTMGVWVNYKTPAFEQSLNQVLEKGQCARLLEGLESPSFLALWRYN